MVDFGGLKFDSSDEPIVRSVGRKKQPVPAEIKTAVANAIKSGKTMTSDIPSSKVATLRRLLKVAVAEAGNYVLKTQETPGDSGRSIFKFSVEPKASE
jgi:hypothetical protein